MEHKTYKSYDELPLMLSVHDVADVLGISIKEKGFPHLRIGARIVVPKEKFIKWVEPYKGKIRKSGTGGIYELNDHLFEGRYSPTNAYGKREVHTVYAKTRDECERLLDEMIPKVRAEIKSEKERLKAQQAARE